MSKGVFPSILFVILIVIALISGCATKEQETPGTAQCTADSDCAPAECCHPSTCTALESRQDCSNIGCTDECRPGTMDCGQGSCRCIKGSCEAVYTNSQESAEEAS